MYMSVLKMYVPSLYTVLLHRTKLLVILRDLISGYAVMFRHSSVMRIQTELPANISNNQLLLSAFA